MTAALRHTAILLFILFSFALCWLALWIIGFYLSANAGAALMLLPQGLRLAMLILLPRRRWVALVLCELLLTTWLHHQQLLTGWALLMSPVVSVLPAWAVQRVWPRYPFYWQRLLLLLLAVSANALLQALSPALWPLLPAADILLTSFTGGLVLTPFIYLIFHYLKQQRLQDLLAWQPPDPPLRTSLLIWCSLFFTIGLCIQLSVSPAMDKLLLIFVFLPNVVMAYRFGWQGGVLASVIGSLMIAVARQISGAFNDLRELELFLSTQALLGIGLGIAISRQQQLAQRLRRYRSQLEQELGTRRALLEKLVHTEEQVRKSLARELHDEIGQNITAIQIQAMLLTRGHPAPAVQAAADHIQALSQRIHITTRQLLRQLRPPVLDEMPLEQAIQHLAGEFAFTERGIDFHFDYRLQQAPADDIIMFTLYRLIQELLNNINKHARASQIYVRLEQLQHRLILEVRDNGIGLSATEPQDGIGLRGSEERVRALGGSWQVQSQAGTCVTVSLPAKMSKTQR